MITKLLDAVTATGNGPITQVSLRGIRGMYAPVQCEITGSASVKLYGRMDATYSWKELASFTASDAAEVVLFPQMMATVDAYTSGSVSLAIAGI